MVLQVFFRNWRWARKRKRRWFCPNKVHENKNLLRSVVTGYSIVVVYTLRVREAPVRFWVSRKEALSTDGGGVVCGVSYSGSTHGWGSCSPSSILGIPIEMEHIWFRKSENGLFWKPITWQGWSISALWLLTNWWYFRRADDASHSISDTLLGVAPFFIISTLLLLLVIRKTSGRNWM